ncbi:transfer beta isoform isoform X2 [Podarcis lilfordi]|uniref:Phosphatidylinositol transfer protein beta isoform n=1 Tax=Podarcis lilfordi TaxID=74358 RepID=A0AA35PQ52_9SAUR|nr:transfer beta isoform isoform X2 [Podarcis lilfordi]
MVSRPPFALLCLQPVVHIGWVSCSLTVAPVRGKWIHIDSTLKATLRALLGKLLVAAQVHDLDPNTWKNVEVVHIDIADRSQVEPGDYKADEDPALFQSVKTKRGPLGPNWKKELSADGDCPKMCAYKLVTIKFKWWGLQNKIENFIQKQEKRIFTNFHRQLFCWIDRWIDLTMEDIRRMEDETQRELEAMRKKGSVRGTLAADV